MLTSGCPLNVKYDYANVQKCMPRQTGYFVLIVWLRDPLSSPGAVISGVPVHWLDNEIYFHVKRCIFC